MEKAMWLPKSFGKLMALMFDTAKTKLYIWPSFFQVVHWKIGLEVRVSKMWEAPLPHESLWAALEEAKNLELAREELSEALAQVPTSKDSRSKKKYLTPVGKKQFWKHQHQSDKSCMNQKT